MHYTPIELVLVLLPIHTSKIVSSSCILSTAMERSNGETQIIPEAVLESTTKTLSYLEELKSQLFDFLAVAEPDVLAEMMPLQRAQALLTLAKTVSTLVTLRLRCSGVHPDNHPVKAELERVSLYQEKFERFNDWSKAPLRPSTTLNCPAATRFIEHSLPDLTPEQRRSMRDLSRTEGAKSSFHEIISPKKRKWQSSDTQSVQIAAQEFLEKASRELLGAKELDMKGPLRDDSSDVEDDSVA
ncbi:hypothetical protein H6P81_000396 [Aristolochia fimbriata]|uniref:Nuclear nucleic acid-binding protein C1D n=1 Tax=Aristolochia fimbriata TaxID=158543 RepID=A0AAV7F487_ARIFI|nr:hypothetical protein H6P81_000396 [Aristolochia fimbriata]